MNYATTLKAEAVDFFVVMDYDSNDAHHAGPKMVNYLPTAPHGTPYIYATRAAAKSACTAVGYDRLCRKEELVGNGNCAYGWTSDWEGCGARFGLPLHHGFCHQP
jgi:hypothetical protein